MRITIATALIAAFGLIAGCGGDDAENATPPGDRPAATAIGDLDGRSYLVGSVTNRELVPSSTVKIDFEDGRVGVNAGCNSISFPYELNDARIEATGPAVSTMMGCEPPLQEQDEWLTEFFTAGVEVETTEGENLLLRGEAIEVELERAD